MFKTEPLYSSTPASGSSNKNLNNLLADDDEPQGEPPGLIQQILSFFSKLWSPSTSDAEKLGYSYVYAEDGSLLGEYGSGGSNSTGTAQYIYLPTASGPMPIAAVIKGQTYAVHSDHLNTPRKLTQPDGQVAWQWAYSAFGDEQPTIGAKRFTSETTTPTTGATSIPEVTFNLRYPGQYFDKETKLHYNYFRTYAPGTGRYTQGDPIGLDGGWNRFGYGNSNPLSNTDPSGLCGPATPLCVWLLANAPWLVPTGTLVAEAGLSLATGTPIPASALPQFAGRALQSASTVVYLGVKNNNPVYVGITKDIAQRACKHGDRFDDLVQLTQKFPRDHARAIEQSIINRNPLFQNEINSIAPYRLWYDDAMLFGGEWMKGSYK